MLEKIKENIAIIAMVICLATMLSQCTTCTRVSNAVSAVEEQKKLTDSIMIVFSSQVKENTESLKKVETKIDSAMYGGFNKKSQPNFIVIKK